MQFFALAKSALAEAWAETPNASTADAMNRSFFIITLQEVLRILQLIGMAAVCAGAYKHHVF
ncbi:MULTISPECIES: hypothetical protein [unclassified Herbaspirillum]|uniref:hypothetical protein n=1 Tax=unclassified Herbaspirillum TaxID=2624150 RepID=UPI001F18B918|nr:MULTISPECIES: hypothetical protein [unclassified Herbaspirillum]